MLTCYLVENDAINNSFCTVLIAVIYLPFMGMCETFFPFCIEIHFSTMPLEIIKKIEEIKEKKCEIT